MFTHVCQKLFQLLLLALTIENIYAAEKSALPDLKKIPTQNQLNPAVADRFWEKWHLVNVRFRTDNDQERFIYANDRAWAVLRDGKRDFPNGSAFAKIAFSMTDDPAFPASKGPDQVVRIQLMEKDSNRFKDTNNWGYALILPQDKDLGVGKFGKEEITACHACHTLVQNRDYVFSYPAFSSPKQHANFSEEKTFAKNFKTLLAANANPSHQKMLGLVGIGIGQTAYQLFELPLFVGSVNEAILPVAKLALESKGPVILADPRSHFFIAANPVQSASQGCPKAVTIALSQKSEPTLEARIGELCNDKIQWQRIAHF